MRASAIMTQNDSYKTKATILLKNLKTLFLGNYINFETGIWYEILDENLNVNSNHLPATTPYHIYPVFVDIEKYLGH